MNLTQMHSSACFVCGTVNLIAYPWPW